MAALRWVCVTCFVIATWLIDLNENSSAQEQKAGRLPQWIWGTRYESELGPEDVASNGFTKSFQVHEPIRSAVLKVAGDFCNLTVSVNSLAVAVEPTTEIVEVDVTHLLNLEDNTISIEATPMGGPAAVAASLSILTGNKTQPEIIVTDESWITPELRPVFSFGTVAPNLWNVDRRPAKLDDSENYEQWQLAFRDTKHARDESFWLAPGYEIQKLRTAKPEEGSWVSMAFDPQGRLTISREEKGLLRFSLDPSSNGVEVNEATVINNELLECRGLLYAHDALYANANNSKGLYRLRDTNGDDQFDEVRLLRSFVGGVGHGRNDLALGPDGWIYSIHGDSVEVPKENITNRTSPFRDQPFGKSDGQGHLIRTDPNGEKWEVVSTGLRNPYGIAVNPRGDWFTYDADAEFDMGAPWYRPTRVVQLFSGADFGWRAITGRWPPYFPDHSDNALPTLDIGKGSPTAVLFASESNFPEEIRRSLLIADWTYGRILAVSLFPRGAGYRAAAQTLMQGRPFNVTDIAIGPDRCLYLITGGRKTQSSLYRLQFTGKNRPNYVTSKHEQHCEAHAAKAQAIRKKLEAMHVAPELGDLETIFEHLGSNDPMLRNVARIALEHQPLETWKDRHSEWKDPNGIVEGFLALSRVGSLEDCQQFLMKDLSFLMQGQGIGSRASALDGLAILYQRKPETDSNLSQLLRDGIRMLVAEVEPGYGMTSYEDEPLFGGYLAHTATHLGSAHLVRQRVSYLLSQLEPDNEPNTSLTLQRLKKATRQEDKLMELLILRSIRGINDEQATEFVEGWRASQDFVTGEGMPGFLNQIRDDFLQQRPEDQRDKWMAEFSRSESTPDETEQMKDVERKLVKKWTMDDIALWQSNELDDRSSQLSYENGAKIYLEAKCAQCHRHLDVGKAVGPDLSKVGARFSKRDILRSILDPSAVISESYQATKIRTMEGETLVGRIIAKGDYRSQKLRIMTDPLRPGRLVEIDKRDIESLSPSDVSPMPSGLLDSFTEKEIQDLLNYLSH